jgi:NADPH:quinone reductase-like Zn-dependent oxidoreductase
MPSNTAAWLPASKAAYLEIKPAPYTSRGENQIVIKNGAVTVNPLDYLKRDMGEMIFSWIKYPFVLGADAADEVVEVGPGITRFKIGDHVVGHAAGMEKEHNTSAECTFQLYTVLQAHMTSAISSKMPYENASVLPLGSSTAACGLFQEDQLGLQYPSLSPKPTGKTLLVWGGSTSVGSNAIQLAVAAGYEVFTTPSPRNFEYVKKLGASKAFDYRSKTVIDDLVRAFEGKTTAGAISIGNGAADACLGVLNHCKGNKFIAMSSYPNPDPLPTRFVPPTFILHYVSWSISTWFKSKVRFIGYKFIWGGTLMNNGVGKAIYEDFLPKALAEGVYIAAPDPLVAGKGLEHLQTALELLKKGVSAKKVVVTLCC